jgi:hypothetical protein
MRTTLVAFAALALVAAPAAAAKPGKRFGIEGEIVGYDEAARVLTVRVVETNVQGRSLSGNTVGGRAPSDIDRMQEHRFAVEPEGSVLRRTVIKDTNGTGLDKSGTPEGFRDALARIPKDRPAVMSCESTDPKLVARGAPKYKILMIQLQYTMDELIERWERISEEVE